MTDKSLEKEKQHPITNLRWYGLIGGPVLALFVALAVPIQITRYRRITINTRYRGPGHRGSGSVDGGVVAD